MSKCAFRRTSRVASFLVLLAAGLGSTAAAQSTAQGTLNGSVKDPNGGLLPGVTVTANQTLTGFARTVVTDGRGESITVTGGADLVTPTISATFRQLSADELLLVPMTTRSFTHLLSAEAGVSADLPPVLINGAPTSASRRTSRGDARISSSGGTSSMSSTP